MNFVLRNEKDFARMISEITNNDNITRGTNKITNEQISYLAKCMRVSVLVEHCKELDVEMLESALDATKSLTNKMQERAIAMMKKLSLEEPPMNWIDVFLEQFDDNVSIQQEQTVRMILENERHTFFKHFPEIAHEFGRITWEVLCYALIESVNFYNTKKQAKFIKENIPDIYIKYVC